VVTTKRALKCCLKPTYHLLIVHLEYVTAWSKDGFFNVRK